MNKGVYPTMITPYKNGEVDYDTVRRLVEWYIEKGCAGVFAVCQSSEMVYLSLKERVKLAETVVEQVNGRIDVVASGHCGKSIEEQAKEITEISKTGIDAFVLVSNRFDIHNDGDDVWIRNAERVLEKADFNINLGIYECPIPYKRCLTPRILDWCKKDGRFRFIKSTILEPKEIDNNLEILKDSEIMFFNANGTTYLPSLKKGACGYSGVMANFHPDLYAWVFDNYEKEPEKAEYIAKILSMASYTENPVYPCTAKYYLNMEGIEMECYSRSSDPKRLSGYQKMIMEQLYELNENLRKMI